MAPQGDRTPREGPSGVQGDEEAGDKRAGDEVAGRVQKARRKRGMLRSDPATAADHPLDKSFPSQSRSV